MLAKLVCCLVAAASLVAASPVAHVERDLPADVGLKLWPEPMFQGAALLGPLAGPGQMNQCINIQGATTCGDTRNQPCIAAHSLDFQWPGCMRFFRATGCQNEIFWHDLDGAVAAQGSTGAGLIGKLGNNDQSPIASFMISATSPCAYS